MIHIKYLHVIAFLLVIVGALNWGLVGLFGYNLVESLFGSMPAVVQAVYVLVGVSAVYILATHSKDCKTCAEMMKGK